MYDIDATLFTNNPEVNIPSWINNTKFTQPVNRTLAVDFDSDIINRKHVLAERSIDDTANIRDIKFTFDDKQLKTYAINQLTKDFRKYRFNIINADVSNGTKRLANIQAKFDKCPLTYTFSYAEQDGQVVKEPFFRTAMENVGQNDYPFSVAGLEDSFEDAKSIDVNKPVKVKANYNYNVITRYDIVKRCNNRLTEAKALIEKHTKEHNIVAVGSNEYASTYDINYLFPDKRVAYAGEKSHTHDFVKNKVATASYEHKSANRLALEANTILNNTFNVNKIISASREDNKLFITAELVHDNVREKHHFNFDVKNETIDKLNYIEDDNCERYTAQQLLNKFGNVNKRVANYLKTTDKVAKGYVYSTKTIYNNLRNFMTHDTINNMLNNWTINRLATKLNSSTYASPYSLQELVVKTNTQLMNDEDIKQIRLAQKTFGEGQNVFFYDNKENDTRNKIAIAKKQQNLDKINNYIGKYFKDFTFDYLGNHQLAIHFDNKHVTASIKNKKIVCDVNGEEIPLATLAKQFKSSKVLTAYLNDNTTSESSDLSKKHNIVITASQFKNKLHNYLNAEDIDSLIKDLETSRKIKKIAKNKYVASASFENLIRDCAYETDEDIKSLNLQKANRLDYLKTLKAFLKDGDTRNNIAIHNQQKRIAKLYNYVDKFLKDYTLKMIDGNHLVISFKADDGKKRNINACIHNNTILCQIGNNDIEIKDLSARFKNSKILKAYLKDNNANDYNRHKIIISKKIFNNKLRDYLAEDDINNIFQNLIDNKLLIKTANDNYASEYSFEDLIRRCDIDVNEEVKAYRLAQQHRKEKQVVADYDLDNDTRQVEDELTVADFENNVLCNLPNNVKCESFDNVVEMYDDNNNKTITAECTLFNTSTGLRSKVTASQNNNGIKLNNNFQENTLVNTYNKFNSNKKSNNKILISKADITRKLLKIANIDNIDNTLNMLEKKQYITDVGNDTYASELTFEQLASLSDITAYNNDDISANYRKANASTEHISKSYHTEETDSKDVKNLEDGRTKDIFNNSKKTCMSKLMQVFNNKKITARKMNEIQSMIEQSNTEMDLNACYNQIARYEV